MSRQSKSTFYLPQPSEEKSEVEDPDEESIEEFEMAAQPKSTPLDVQLLDGELIAYKTEKVLKLHDSTSKAGAMGHLYCTNFRLSFVTATANDASKDSNGGRHKFIGSDDVILSNISVIYQVSSDKTSKKLSRNKKMSHPKHIRIHTKDVGIHYFSFEFTTKKDRNNLISAIQRFAFHQRHDWLFAHVFACNLTSVVNGHTEDERRLVDRWRPAQYTSPGDWEKELLRLDLKSMWRVTTVNERFAISPTMPEHFVVPNCLPDKLLADTVLLSVGKRLPMWCYTHTNGYSLVAFPTMTTDSVNTTTEKQALQAMKDTQPLNKNNQRSDMLDLDLNKEIALVADIKAAFTRMCALCCPETVSEFYSTDNSIYSQLDSAHWLRYVCSSLRTSNHIATQIHEGLRSAIIREDTGADLTCVIASLVQVILDAHCRTIRGFQSLIQRCWVAAGHPFCDRLGIINTSERNVTPVFLLFLDCVYQLTVQYPSSFEFSEIYLISLWDSCVVALFEEFLFDSSKERHIRDKPVGSSGSSSRVVTASQGQLPSVWSWDMQFNADFLALFRNPLHEFELLQRSAQQTQLPQHQVLKPNFHSSQIDVWIGFFYRNTSSMQIVNGGKPAEYFQQCLLMEEIIELQNQIAKLQRGVVRNSGLYFNACNPSRSDMLEKLKTSYITSTFPFNNSINRNVSDISLCTLLDRSLVLSDHTAVDNGDEDCVV